MSESSSQLKMAYWVAEDRLLLRIGAADEHEHRLWLTRRFVKRLWGVLEEAVEHHRDVKAKFVREMKPDVKTVRKPDTEPSKEAGGEPLLLTGVELGPVRKQGIQIVLETRSGRKIRLNLDKQRLYSLCRLVMSSVDKAKWDLDLKITDAGVVISEERPTVH